MRCSQQDGLKHGKNMVLCVFRDDYSVVQIIIAIILLHWIDTSVEKSSKVEYI